MRSVLLTGTKAGIGLEFVKQILATSPRTLEIVIATVRKISGAPELKALADANPKLHILELDLNDTSEFDAFANQVRQIVGPKGLNVVFHIAGIIRGDGDTTLDLVKVEDLVDQFKINTVAPIMLTKALLPLLKTASESYAHEPLGVHRAAVFYISSQLGSIANNKTGRYWGYRESKCAGNMAMKSISEEMKNQHIGTLMLHPGWVQTSIGGSYAPLTPKQSVEGLLPTALSLNEQNNGCFFQFDGTHLPW